MLLFINNSKQKTTRYLGFFILLFSLGYIPSILEGLEVLKYYPRLTFLPLDFNWLVFPLFYIYVQEVSIIKTTKKYWILLPGVISLIFQTILFFLPIKTTNAIYATSFYNISFYLSLLFGLFIGIKTIFLINKHKKELVNQYASTENKDLIWAQIFVFCGIAFTIIKGLLILINYYDSFNILFIITDVSLLYWVSLKGIQQKNSFDLLYTLEESKRKENIKREKGDTKNAEIEIENLFNTITQSLLQSEEYLKNDFNLIHLGDIVKMHPRKVSIIINKVSRKNFNSYINSLRIEKAKEIIKNKKHENYTIEAIGNKVGFNSKSSFFKAFKKETGITPLQFRNIER